MRVLVAHGSRHGGTEEIAQWVASTFKEAGHQVDVRDARELEGLEAYDAVIVGGALYAFRWPWRVYRFLARHRDELERMPVWFFSSGPLDHSATEKEVPPVRSVARWMRRVQARGHTTFGGRLDADAKGFIARSLVEKGLHGDFRDFTQVRAWSLDVATQLLAMPDPLPRAEQPSEGRRWLRRAVALLCLFTGVTALVGGVELMTWRTGASWLPPISVLEQTPFADYFLPGLLLFLFVGLTNVAAAVLEGRRSRWGERAGMVGGAAIVGWIISEMVLLRAPSVTEVAYLVVGALTLAGSAWLFSRRRAAVRLHSL